MFTRTLTIAAVFATGLTAAPALHAGEMTQSRVLRIPAGLCTSFKSSLSDWAATVSKNGAFAVPVMPASMGNPGCDADLPMVPVGTARGFDTQGAADAAALETCNAARPEGYRPCVVVGRSYLK